MTDYQLAFSLDMRLDDVRSLRAKGFSDEEIARNSYNLKDDLELDTLECALCMVNGKLTSVRDVARYLNVSVNMILSKIKRDNMTLQQAYDFFNVASCASPRQQLTPIVSNERLHRVINKYVNGVKMRAIDVAEMLGVKVTTFNAYVSHERCTYQQAYDYFVNRKTDAHTIYYNVHGRDMTINQMSDELGIAKSTLTTTKCLLKLTYEQTYDYYLSKQINQKEGNVL